MPDDPIAQYRFRRSALEKETTYSLFHDRLVIEGEGVSPRWILLGEVRAVHLKYEHTKQRGYYNCHIHTARGRVDLRHLHWAGFADFEDRRASYTPFVRALLAQLAPHPNVKYKAGSAANFVAAIVGAPLMLVLGIVALSFGLVVPAIGALLMMAVCLIMIAPSRPRTLDPLSPPADLLPS